MTTTINGDESLEFVPAASRVMNNLRDRVYELDTVIGAIN